MSESRIGTGFENNPSSRFSGQAIDDSRNEVSATTEDDVINELIENYKGLSKDEIKLLKNDSRTREMIRNNFDVVVDGVQAYVDSDTFIKERLAFLKDARGFRGAVVEDDLVQHSDKGTNYRQGDNHSETRDRRSYTREVAEKENFVELN